MFSTPLLFSVSMETNIEAREYGWTDSSDSNVSEDLFAKELESHLLSSEDDEVLFARHGPVVEPDLEDVALQRDFWNCCAIGFLLDYRKVPSTLHAIHCDKCMENQRYNFSSR